VRHSLTKRLSGGETTLPQEELQHIYETIRDAYGVTDDAICMSVTYSKPYTVQVTFDESQSPSLQAVVLSALRQMGEDDVLPDRIQSIKVALLDTGSVTFLVTYETQTCHVDAMAFPFHEEEEEDASGRRNMQEEDPDLKTRFTKDSEPEKEKSKPEPVKIERQEEKKSKTRSRTKKNRAQDTKKNRAKDTKKNRAQDNRRKQLKNQMISKVRRRLAAKELKNGKPEL